MAGAGHRNPQVREFRPEGAVEALHWAARLLRAEVPATDRREHSAVNREISLLLALALLLEATAAQPMGERLRFLRESVDPSYLVVVRSWCDRAESPLGRRHVEGRLLRHAGHLAELRRLLEWLTDATVPGPRGALGDTGRPIQHTA